MTEKFRSIKAFKNFEQRSLGVDAEEDSVQRHGAGKLSLSPIRVLAVLKKHPQGVYRRDLATEVEAPLPAVDEALLHLLKDDLVKLRPGATPEDDLVVP
jgi:hypothetical protein